MAAVNPRVIWKGHSFDWYAGTNFEKFLEKILKDAEAHASSPIKNGIQGQMTDQDFINETGIDDINDLSSLPDLSILLMDPVLIQTKSNCSARFLLIIFTN